MRVGTARSGMTLIEITVVILVLLSLISVIFIGAQAWKRGSDRSTCILNIRNVQIAARSYQNMYQKEQGSTFDSADLLGDENYLPVLPICPSGGNYEFAPTYPPIGQLFLSCDYAGHAPSKHDSW